MSENQPNPEAVYRIKPLVWTPAQHPDDKGVQLHAVSVFGSYYLQDAERMTDTNGYDSPAQWSYCFCDYYDEGTERVDDLDAAKAAAEAHYRQRLMSALEQVKP